MNNKFSKREKQIIEQLFNGYSIKQIAEMFGLSTHTIKAHINRIYIKAGLHDFSGNKRILLCSRVYRVPDEGIEL